MRHCLEKKQEEVRQTLPPPPRSLRHTHVDPQQSLKAELVHKEAKKVKYLLTIKQDKSQHKDPFFIYIYVYIHTRIQNEIYKDKPCCIYVILCLP